MCDLMVSCFERGSACNVIMLLSANTNIKAHLFPHQLTSNKRLCCSSVPFHEAVNVTHGAFKTFQHNSWFESKHAPAHLFSKPHKGLFIPKVDCHLKMSGRPSISQLSHFNLCQENPNNIGLHYLNDLTCAPGLLAGS